MSEAVLELNRAAGVSSRYREGYFMSAEQEEQARAMVLLRFTDAKKRLAVLREEAITLGRELSELGSALIHEPERVAFEDQTVSLDYVANKPRFRAAILDFGRIARLAEDIRTTLDERNRLEARVKELGLGE